MNPDDLYFAGFKVSEIVGADNATLLRLLRMAAGAISLPSMGFAWGMAIVLSTAYDEAVRRGLIPDWWAWSAAEFGQCP